MDTGEITKTFPEIKSFLLDQETHPRNPPGVLYLQVEGYPRPVPICAVLPLERTYNEETEGYTNGRAKVVWLEESSKLNDQAKERIGKVILKWFAKNCPVQTTITTMQGKLIDNPLSSDFLFLPKRDFFESNEEAMKIRELSIALLTKVQKSINSGNTIPRLISELDQEAQALSAVIQEHGFDLNTRSMSEREILHDPLSYALFLAFQLVTIVSEATAGSESSQDEMRSGLQHRADGVSIMRVDDMSAALQNFHVNRSSLNYLLIQFAAGDQG